mgnify:CR=1 FL=1
MHPADAHGLRARRRGAAQAQVGPSVGAANHLHLAQREQFKVRRLDPARPGVVSIGTIQGGSAPNVIPERVALSGTLRSTEPDTRRLLLDEVRWIAEATAAAHGMALPCASDVREVAEKVKHAIFESGHDYNAEMRSANDLLALLAGVGILAMVIVGIVGLKLSNAA